MLDLAFALEDTYVYFPLLPTHLTLSCDLSINRTCDSSPMSSMCLDGADNRSRLGCQVFLTKEVDGMVAKLPSATRNMYVDGESFPLSFIPFRTLPFLLDATLGRNGKQGNQGNQGRETARPEKRLLMTRRQG
jgi:hypothetical protein